MEKSKEIIITVQNLIRDNQKDGKVIAELDDGTKIRISTSQVADFNIFVGRELSSDELSELFDAVGASKSKAQAIRILGNRRFSASEIKKRLIKKGDNEEIAEQTVIWLEEIGLVNDYEYANLLVKHYITKSYGIARIRDEFFKRGIPREIWDEVLESIDEEEVQDSITSLLRKKLGTDFDRLDIKRAQDALIRRGYTYEQVNSAINIYTENL